MRSFLNTLRKGSCKLCPFDIYTSPYNLNKAAIPAAKRQIKLDLQLHH
jgi:hypothetical protein